VSDGGDEVKYSAPTNSLLWSLLGATFQMLYRGADLGWAWGASSQKN